MAGTSFLVLTNKLLRRLNEVELTDADFTQARGVQATAKDCIIAAIQEINTSEHQWPWNKQTGSAWVSNGTQEVSFGTAEINDTSGGDGPINIPVTNDAVPDWDSFRIRGTIARNPDLPDDEDWVETPHVPSDTLKYMTREEWYKYYRQLDVDSVSSDGKGTPAFVFPSVGGFGVSPMPNNDFIIQYEYYSVPTEMVLSDSTSSIPPVWDYVIINLALKHFYMYKDNIEAAGMANTMADKSFSKMRNSVVNRADYMWATVVNYGGRTYSVDYTKI